MTTDPEVIARDFAQLAREIAMDIFPLADVLKLHQLDEDTWGVISNHPTFIKMIESMSRDWQSAESTPERVKVKAQTAAEGTIEVFYRDIHDRTIPLAQRVEAAKLLARLGELGEKRGGEVGEKFTITFNIGTQPKQTVEITPVAQAKTIEHVP